MAKLSNKQMQRWLAVGLLVAVILIVSLVVILPVVNKGLELHEAKNNLVFSLQQYERILARKDAVIAKHERHKRAVSRTWAFEQAGYRRFSVRRGSGVY